MEDLMEPKTIEQRVKKLEEQVQQLFAYVQGDSKDLATLKAEMEQFKVSRAGGVGSPERR
jgi:predicted RNase H-like nuclease (RuvC/YqgF family)